MIKKVSFLKSVSFVVVVAVLSLSLSPAFAQAASITTASDTMSREKASTASDHTFLFVTPTGMASGTNMTLVFSSDFTGIGSLVGADFDFAEGSTGVCSSASFTEKSVVTSSPSSSQFSIAGASQTVTITSGGASATITAGRCVRLKVGLNATDTTGSGPGTHQITSGAADDDDTVTIGGSFGDSGTITVDIIDDDQVTISATVNQTLSFDLDTAEDFTNGEDAAPYSIDFGTLSTGAVSVSNTSSVKMIVAEGATNASGGMNVTVANTNGTDGLKSTSTPADKITSSTATMAAGTTNYGLCVATSGLTGFTRATGYVGDTCALSSGTNGVQALSTTPTNILTSSAPVSSGHAEIVGNAAISGSVPAHTDYSDTLTFVATANF